MSIRKLEYDDIPSVARLLNELGEALHEDSHISMLAIQRQYGEMQRAQDTYENYVYEENGKVIGFISLLNYKSIYHRNGTTQINELIVSEEYRNRGIGKRLLEYAKCRAKAIGMDEIEVGVMKENTAAIDFYKKNGMDEEYFLLGMEFEC